MSRVKNGVAVGSWLKVGENDADNMSMEATALRLMCLLLAGITVGACSNDDADRRAEPAVEADVTTATTTESPGCLDDRRMLEVAVETYFANGGAIPATETALVQSSLLREESPGFDLGPNSEVVPTAGGPCA
jgi:hypothetical protein